MLNARHAGDEAPLRAAGEEQLQGRPVLFPYPELPGFGGLHRLNAQALGIIGSLILNLAVARPPPASVT